MIELKDTQGPEPPHHKQEHKGIPKRVDGYAIQHDVFLLEPPLPLPQFFCISRLD